MVFSTLIDVYSNFWCVMLSYSCFKIYYDGICGCLHFKCKSVWNKIAGKDEKMLKSQTELSTENETETTSNQSV
eukprot:UN02441